MKGIVLAEDKHRTLYSHQIGLQQVLPIYAKRCDYYPCGVELAKTLKYSHHHNSYENSCSKISWEMETQLE